MPNSKINKIIQAFNEEEINKKPFSTGVLQVNFQQLESNINQIISFASENKAQPVKFLLPVKANAYGHGMIPVAKFMEQQKLCSYFGVAHAQEAYLLRANGLKTPILIMGQISIQSKEIIYIIKNKIELAISDAAFLSILNQQAQKLNQIAQIHLLVDTGMGRGGVLWNQAKEILDKIHQCAYVKLVGVMTHFSVADSLEESDIAYTNEQINKFKQVRAIVMAKFNDPQIIFHTSNSGGSMENRASVFDMIRPGIAVYGYPEHQMGLKLKPVMNLVSQITLIKKYPQNHAIGYGKTYHTKADNTYIAIVPIGYGDGLNRLLSNQLTPILNNKKTISVGRISMDQFSILVDETAKVGDKVIIIGEGGKLKNDATNMASQIKTITYEILCNLGNASRIRHEYSYEGGIISR